MQPAAHCWVASSQPLPAHHEGLVQPAHRHTPSEYALWLQSLLDKCLTLCCDITSRQVADIALQVLCILLYPLMRSLTSAKGRKSGGQGRVVTWADTVLSTVPEEGLATLVVSRLGMGSTAEAGHRSTGVTDRTRELSMPVHGCQAGGEATCKQSISLNVCSQLNKVVRFSYRLARIWKLG